MIYTELRPRLRLSPHQCWSSRVIAWLRSRGLTKERGGGGQLCGGAPTAAQIMHARTSLADSERTGNSLATRLAAAIQAIEFLDQKSLDDAQVKRYLAIEYERPLGELELRQYHAHPGTGTGKTIAIKSGEQMSVLSRFVATMLRDEERSRTVISVAAGAAGLAAIVFAAVSMAIKTWGVR